MIKLADTPVLPYVSPRQELPIYTGKGESSYWNTHNLSDKGPVLVLKEDDEKKGMFFVVSAPSRHLSRFIGWMD